MKSPLYWFDPHRNRSSSTSTGCTGDVACSCSSFSCAAGRRIHLTCAVSLEGGQKDLCRNVQRVGVRLLQLPAAMQRSVNARITVSSGV